MDTIQQGASPNPPTPITIGFSAKERAGIQMLLSFYGQCVRAGLPPGPERRDELIVLTRLRTKLAVLEKMQDGETIEIDAASLLIVEHACLFFLAGAGWLPFEEPVSIALTAAAEEIQRVVVEAQG